MSFSKAWKDKEGVKIRDLKKKPDSKEPKPSTETKEDSTIFPRTRRGEN